MRGKKVKYRQKGKDVQGRKAARKKNKLKGVPRGKKAKYHQKSKDIARNRKRKADK